MPQPVAMLHQQIQQEIGIPRIILGPGGIQRLAHRGRHAGSYGEQVQTLVLAQHAYQRPLHLLHRHRDWPPAEAAAECTHPGLHRFRLVLHFTKFALRRTGLLQAPYMLLICRIDTHERNKLQLRRLRFFPRHNSLLPHSCLLVVPHRQRLALLPRSPYSESWGCVTLDLIPSGQAPLLGPSPLRTGRDSFLSSGSSPSSRLQSETWFGNRETQAMNPIMALGMKENAVLSTARTTHHAGHAVMQAPPREAGDFCVTHRAEAALFIPEIAKKTRAPKRVPHMIPFAFLKVGLIGRLVGIRITSNLDMSAYGSSAC